MPNNRVYETIATTGDKVGIYVGLSMPFIIKINGIFYKNYNFLGDAYRCPLGHLTNIRAHGIMLDSFSNTCSRIVLRCYTMPTK